MNEILNGVTIPFGKLVKGDLVQRPNRFLAMVDLNGEQIRAHVPDPGRLEELLFPGNKVMVRHVHSKTRKTQYDLVLAAFQNIWVCIDTRYPNKLFETAVKHALLKEFSDYTWIHREVTLKQAAKNICCCHTKALIAKYLQNLKIAKPKTPESRFDFMVGSDESRPCLIEVKSVNLCVDGTGLFPDAPTLRGARHLHELKDILLLGLDTCSVFIAQREDIKRVSAHKERDPHFAAALEEAFDAGVKIFAYRCDVTPEYIKLIPNTIPYCR